MVEVSASILNMDNENAIKNLYELETALIDYFHIDVMDGKFVKDNTIEKMIERYYLSPIRKVMNWTKTKVGKLFGKDGDEDDTK